MGTKKSTWRELALKFNRDPSGWKCLRKRYLYTIDGQRCTSGTFSIQEDQIIIEKLFNGKEGCMETVRNTSITFTHGIPELNRTGRTAYYRWRGVLQPILMSYHLGMLHTNWKYNFCAYIAEKRVHYKKEIDWNEVCKLYPAQNVSSLIKVLMHFKDSKEEPLWKSIKDNIHKRKNTNDYTEKEKSYREEIVKIYLETCKVQSH